MKSWFIMLFGAASVLIFLWLAARGGTDWAQETKLAQVPPPAPLTPEPVRTVPILRGIILLTNAHDVVASGITNFAGLWIDPIPELTGTDRESLASVLQPYWDQPLTPE